MTPRRLLSPFLLPAAALALLAMPAQAQDFDGDAIPDSVENQSWYINAGGSPESADVWVECDYMPGTVKKRSKLKRRAEATFDRAPYPGGIALHIAFDDKLHFEETWGNINTSEGIPQFLDRVADTYNNHFDGAPFSGANAATMRQYTHYCTFINSFDNGFGTTGIALSSTQGVGIPGDIFVVALGQLRHFTPKSVLRSLETGTLLHELGHNLGLTHGGSNPKRDATYKPNYLSVMNYFYQGGFVRRDGNMAEYFAYWDYSRSATNKINEKKLDEARGIEMDPDATVTQTAAADTLVGLTYCPSGLVLPFLWNGPIDFDCDQTIDAGKVKVDTNNDGHKTKLGGVQVDWDHLRFDGGMLGGQTAGQVFTALDPADELTLELLQELLRKTQHLQLGIDRPYPQ